MEKLETGLDGGQTEKCGVLGHRIENNHYVVNIRWKDGAEMVKRFPVDGFDVVNPADHRRVGSIDGKKALKILEEHAGECNSEEFSWRDFLN